MKTTGRLLWTTTVLALALNTVAALSPATAGGFQRGVPDTDILYEPGFFTMRTGLTYVDPQRGFESINGVRSDNGDYTGTYNIPSVAIGFGGEVFGCAGTYTEPFAAEGDYGDTLDGALPAQRSGTLSSDNRDRLPTGAFGEGLSRTVRTDFTTNEFAATCRASYTVQDVGRFSLLGGIFFEDFDFEGQSVGVTNITPLVAPGLPAAAQQAIAAGQGAVVLPVATDVRVEDGYEPGYRVGLAYEKPEIALRVQALYKSEVEHNSIEGTGVVSALGGAVLQLPTGAMQLGNVAADTVIPVDAFLNDQKSPQYLTINAQTGIAQDTLLLASFRWTDWSTNEYAISSVVAPGGAGSSSSLSPYHWRDGYTATLGLGRAFNDSFSGAVQIGYDRGVSTGAETTYTDLYTLAGGVSFTGSKFGEIRLGGLVGYWTDGEQKISDGAYFNGRVGDDIVLGANASLKLTF